MNAPQEFPSAALGALERGDKIGAIKCVREAQSCGLKEAKDSVDRYLQKHPEVSNRMSVAQSESRKTGLHYFFFALIAVIAYATVMKR